MSNGFTRVIFWILIVGNIIGAIFGFTFWYGGQLLASPLKYWLFIASCPVFSTLFVVCALLIYFKKKFSLLFYLTAVGLVKYGLWTIIYWANYNNTSIANWLFLWLIFSHSTMVLESIILYSRIEFKKSFIIFGWLLFALYDYVNYVLKTVTTKVAVGNREMYVAIVLTVVIPVLVFYLVKWFRYKNWKVLV